MISQHGTLEISRARLRHNLTLLREQAGRATLCPTIKANAYGHGIHEISNLLLDNHIEWACVYNLQEAEPLQNFNTLILAPLEFEDDADLELSHDFRPLQRMAGRLDDQDSRSIRLNITSIGAARHLSAFASKYKIRGNIRVHMQIDAGLTRLGIEPREAPALADVISSLPHLTLEGAFAHFSHGDEPGHVTVQEQMTALLHAADEIKVKHPRLCVHIQNSGGAFHLLPAHKDTFDLVRVGIALYGLQPSMRHPISGLRPIARVTAPILAVHERGAGIGVGYGHTFVTKRPTRLGIVPVGYADGYPRALSNNCVAQIREVDVPVVGRVSMDQIILDITDLPDAIAAGESVTVISDDPAKPNSLDRMAETLGTIGYELATHLGSRLKRVIVD